MKQKICEGIILIELLAGTMLLLSLVWYFSVANYNGVFEWFELIPLIFIIISGGITTATFLGK